MKRLLSLLLCAVMLLTMAACGKEPAAETTTEPETTQAQTTESVPVSKTDKNAKAEDVIKAAGEILTKEDAIRIGAVGPQARASNWAIDVRKDAPYSSYEDFDFNVAVWDSCDVFSRVVIRVLENFESIKIIRQALDMLPSGPINLGLSRIPKIPAGEYMIRYEAPRGQLCYKVVSNGGEFNKRVSIHVPTFRNAPTVPTMLRGNSVADAGLIVASIDPCFSCMDR